MAIQCISMVPPSNQGPNLGDARQMCGVKTADGPAPDDTDALHSLDLCSPFHLHQVAGPANLSFERSKQAVGIVERVRDKDSLIEQSILQSGGDGVDGRGPALAHPLG